MPSTHTSRSSRKTWSTTPLSVPASRGTCIGWLVARAGRVEPAGRSTCKLLHQSAAPRRSPLPGFLPHGCSDHAGPAGYLPQGPGSPRQVASVLVGSGQQHLGVFWLLFASHIVGLMKQEAEAVTSLPKLPWLSRSPWNLDPGAPGPAALSAVCGAVCADVSPTSPGSPAGHEHAEQHSSPLADLRPGARG